MLENASTEFAGSVSIVSYSALSGEFNEIWGEYHPFYCIPCYLFLFWIVSQGDVIYAPILWLLGVILYLSVRESESVFDMKT